MSDTVSGAVIVSSLGSEGPTFLSLPDALDAGALSAVHVHGGAYMQPASFSLMVDFSTLSPDLQVVPSAAPAEPPASVAGYAGLLPDEPSPNVAGAMHQS
jgi:hypothetical protein